MNRKSYSMPPRWARALMMFLAVENDREALLGDLEEEFQQRQRVSPVSARRWYLGQALRSGPHLAWQHICKLTPVQVLTRMVLMLAVVLIPLFWDAHLALHTAWRLGAYLAVEQLALFRGIYLIIFGFGYGLLGLVIAHLWSLVQSRKRMGASIQRMLFGCLVLGVMGGSLLDADSLDLLMFRCLQTIVAMVALLAGAGLQTRWFVPTGKG